MSPFDDATWFDVALWVGFVTFVTWMVWQSRLDRRQRVEAERSGEFSATAYLHAESYLGEPHHAPLRDSIDLPRWERMITVGPFQRTMKGTLHADRNTVTWTPSAHRRRQGIPTLSAEPSDVDGVSSGRLPLVGAFVLGIEVCGGAVWIFRGGYTKDVAAHLQRVGHPVD